MHHRPILALIAGLVALLLVACPGGAAPAAAPGLPAPTEVTDQSGSPTPGPAEHRAAADRAYSGGNWSEAIEEYTGAIALDATFGDYYQRAFAHGQLGNLDQAVADLTEAIALDPEEPAGYNQRAVYYNSLGKWEEAVVDLDRAIELRPDRPDQYNGRAFAHLNLGNWDQVVADMNTALGLSPDDDPLVPIYLSNRAAAYSELGEHELALADLDRSIALDPTNFTSHRHRIGVLIALGRLEDAVARAEELGESLGSPAAGHLLLSDQLREAGLLVEAIEQLDRAIEIDPESPVLHEARALTYALLGEVVLAREDYEVALDLTSDPGHRAEIEATLADLG